MVIPVSAFRDLQTYMSKLIIFTHLYREYIF